MSDRTGINYCDATWNPVTGCTKISEGCWNCWACRLAATRLKNYPRYKGLARLRDCTAFDSERGKPYLSSVPEWTGEVRTHPGLLEQPLHWRKPKRIFVCSQADLFHKSIPASFVVSVFEVMSAATQHTFLVLTKRPERIKSVLFGEEGRWYFGSGDYLPNVWLGVSVEDQKTADERIPLLLQTPAAVRFVSYEPALGPLDLRVFDNQKGLDYSVFKNARALIPDWVIAGGESGPSPRPADIAWFRQVRDQCQAADMPFFMKQIITNGKKIPWEQFPEDLRIRQFPDKESA